MLVPGLQLSVGAHLLFIRHHFLYIVAALLYFGACRLGVNRLESRTGLASRVRLKTIT
jgi:hypothetical protein